MLLPLIGCGRADLPLWHQTVVFRDQGAAAAADHELPVDLKPVRSSTDALGECWVIDGPEVRTGKIPGFNEALVSWNIRLEPGAAASIELAVSRYGAGDWSEPMRLAALGNTSLLPAGRAAIAPEDRGAGFIDVDYFRARTPFTAAKVRLAVRTSLPRHASGPPARLERLSICLSNTMDRARTSIAALVGGARGMPSCNDVPFRSQRTDDPSLAGRLCSPTSLAMVMAFHGVDRPVEEVAALVRDPVHDLFGNWPFNIQGAFELGVPGYLTRFNDWESVASHLSRGEPLIASIRAPRGVLRNAPYQELDSGHLIVLAGLDGRGGVYVNDPAAGTEALGRRVYAMSDLTTAWMDLGNGTAYVLMRPCTAGEASR